MAGNAACSTVHIIKRYRTILYSAVGDGAVITPGNDTGIAIGCLQGEFYALECRILNGTFLFYVGEQTGIFAISYRHVADGIALAVEGAVESCVIAHSAYRYLLPALEVDIGVE